jgi:hypothetical protein
MHACLVAPCIHTSIIFGFQQWRLYIEKATIVFNIGRRARTEKREEIKNGKKTISRFLFYITFTGPKQEQL